MPNPYLTFLPADLRPDPMPSMRSQWWRWRDTEVHVARAGPVDAERHAVVLHGAGGHAGAVWPFAAVLAGHGFSVAVPDLPGYGHTRVPDRGAIRYPHWVELATEFVAAEAQTGPPPLLLGASMGGMLAYEVATRTGAARGVLATCLLDPREAAVRERIARTPLMGRHASGTLRALAGPLASLRVPMRLLANMRAMSHDPELVSLVISDKLGGGNAMPLGFLRSFLESAPAFEPETVREPRFVLAHPAADTWTPVELSRPFFDRIAAPKELILLGNAGHYPIESPGAQQLLEAALRC